MRKKILIIGAVPHPDDLRSYGGVTTLMQNFIDFCRERHVPFQHIDTYRYRNRAANLLHFAAAFLWGVLTSRVVMYNVCHAGAFVLFRYTAPLAFALRRKVVFRKFGGAFLTQLEECPPARRQSMVTLLNRASVIYFETRALMDESPRLFQHPERIRWFPNGRRPAGETVSRHYGRRFVFVSHMNEDKGVSRLVRVADRLPEGYTVHLYGPIYDERYADDNFWTGHRAEYHGALRSAQVLPTLRQYDVLVLPTICASEGYPGIITEAMSVAMPVVASRIGGIPEMVSNGENGLLTAPGDEEALYQALLSIDEENYAAMSARSLARFNEHYNSDTINAEVCRTLCAL